MASVSRLAWPKNSPKADRRQSFSGHPPRLLAEAPAPFSQFAYAFLRTIGLFHLTMHNERQSDTLTRLESQASLLQSKHASLPCQMDGVIRLAMELTAQEFANAIGMSQEAHLHSELLRPGRGFSIRVARTAWLSFLRGRTDEALVHATHADFIADRVDSDALRCGARTVLALVHQTVADYEAAESIWLDLLSIARRSGDAVREADYLSALATMRTEQSRHTDALELRLRAQHLYQLTNDQNLPLSCNSLARAYLNLGRFDKAVHWSKQAISLCDRTAQLWHCWFVHTMGVCHLEQGKLEIAQRHLEEAFFVSQTGTNDIRTQVKVLIDLGRLHCAANRTGEAIQHSDLALALLARQGDAVLEAQAHRVLREAFQLIGARDLADMHARRRIELGQTHEQDKQIELRAVTNSHTRVCQMRSA